MSKPEYNTNAVHYQPQASESGLGDLPSPDSDYPLSWTNQPSPVKGMYPLLDLISEHGCSGLGNVSALDKIIIAQESLQEFINALSPGAYSSITKVNFKILDDVVLKPFGIYGSKEEIVRFLCEIKAVDHIADSAQKLLEREGGDTAGGSEPFLGSGLYIVRSLVSASDEQAYVVYWPEDTTWDDHASSSVQRNRVTFMREHSKALVWGNEDNDKADEECDDDDDEDEDDDASTDSENTDPDRFISFQVAKTKDQEENVSVRAGFVVNFALLINRALPPHSNTDSKALCPALLHGEKVQGFMTATFVPATKNVDLFCYDGETAEQIRLRFEDGVALALPENLNIMSTKALITALGLHTRFPKENDAWERGNTDIERRFQKVLSRRTIEMHEKIEGEFEHVQAEVEEVFVSELLKLFPSLRRERFLTKSRAPKPPAESSVGPGVETPEFQFKKRRVQFLRILHSGLRGTTGVSTDQTRHVAEAVLRQQDDRSILSVLENFAKDEKGILSRMRGFFRSSTGEEGMWLGASKRAESISDSQFLLDLRNISVDNDLHEAIIDVEETAYSMLKKKVDTLVTGIGRQIILSTQKKECEKQIQREMEIEENKELKILWSNFVRQVKDVSTQHSTSRTIAHLDHFEVKKAKYSRDTTYNISGRREILQGDEIEYRIHLLHLRADESHKVQLDPSYVPTPTLEKRLTHSFRVSSSTVVKYAHLLEGDRILLGLVDPRGKILIYVESLSRIDAAIQRRSFAMQLHRDKIGETCLFALDESKRMLAVYSSARMQLHIFAFEPEGGSLRGLGSAIDLLPFYNFGESILHACFVHGLEEILFVDSNAQARIFSLTMLQPKERRRVHGDSYHWTTFASTDGIPITLPDFPVDLGATLLTCIVNRNNIHLIGLDLTTQSCRSIILDITSKAAEFTFQEQRSKASISRGKETTHNCLIDCHSEVWTRFPVVAAVKRRTITSSSKRHPRTLTFVTDQNHRPFSAYFLKMICSFTKTSRKPTGDVLESTTVSARTFASFARAFVSNPEWPVSRFRAGEWLADLLCLIPIHIAITHENRFLPLKDGVLSTGLERSLLGAEVNRIVDNLSIGWYESIFQSYWASKPVKVVSSMGEQSVGKSFALNHLLDTSFAGSAMRTTEGVWLSVSPTDDALIVALDFEGVHSLERSAQEDTLLVLFNTALSNLVGSCVKPLILAIMLRSAFSLKFQKIVENERDSNFITRLHTGKLNIIPWPLIESEGFYHLFRRVKKTLDQQPTSHHTAGEFLLTLKTLMAKLKANDWGAMSQTMAMHRANSLLEILPNALETGLSEIDPMPVPLKNFDTDVVIEAKDTKTRFVLTGPKSPVADHERALTNLRDSWDQAIKRQNLDDSKWHSDLIQHLTYLVDLRVAHVKKWLESNVQRFEGVHASIEELRRTFDSAVIDLRASIEICRSKCGVFIVAPSANATAYQLGPVVKMLVIQEIIFAELRFIYADNRAGSQVHGHPIHHDDDGSHLCSALVHMCGQPCRLTDVRLPSGKLFTCSGTCYVPLNTEHTDHECEDRECPASCQLCNRMCSGGHTHGLKPGQYHLCGEEHPCRALCAAGICEIQTKPHAIEATFVGTHTTFQYTKYSQVAKHLPCAKMIKPGEVDHPGPHIHSNDAPFHYCDTRTYLSAGHSQQEHETSHGSMSQTRWVVDESEGTGLEIGGNKFSSTDHGGPMLCNLVCKSMGRHAHVDICRGFDSHNSKTQHITARIPPNPDQDKDWITHALHWLRMGPEHTTESGGAIAHSSGCTLPIFHTPLSTKSSPRGPGYVPNDGHHFTCKNPALLQPAFHVIFVMDKSGSMSWTDQSPLPNAPGANWIKSKANNRLGAVFSSLYSFWLARQAFDRSAHSSGGFRRDAYSLILFDSEATTCIENDFLSSPEELLTTVLEHEAGGDTDFTRALKKTHEVMISYWSNERTPVVIFLSDGWCKVSDEPMYDLCRDASRRGMVEIAKEIQQTVPQDPLADKIPSSFTEALDTVHLTTTFQGFAESLQKPRGHLISSRVVSNRQMVEGSGGRHEGNIVVAGPSSWVTMPGYWPSTCDALMGI
ncbi:hypothetical protein EI94DRAFT_1705222 [Lactarius quietus]|nr:hypothetical protein EI94DRAFT_1705222 [Lactarius quietus]